MYTNWTYKFYVAQASPSAVAQALGEFGIKAATLTLAKGLWDGEAVVTTVVEIIALVEQDVLPLARFLRDRFLQQTIMVTKTEEHFLLVEAK